MIRPNQQETGIKQDIVRSPRGAGREFYYPAFLDLTPKTMNTEAAPSTPWSYITLR
jgi:hypothetical protein